MRVRSEVRVRVRARLLGYWPTSILYISDSTTHTSHLTPHT